MRCDYDMNDVIDPRANTCCQIVLTCRWKGIRGCERQFCHFHAGSLTHWPSACMSQSSQISLLPCEDCEYWIRHVKCKFCGLILMFLVWLAIVAAIIFYSAQSARGAYDYEYKNNLY